MIRHLAYTRERLAQTSELLRASIYPERVAPDALLIAGPVDRISVEEAERLDYRAAKLRTPLGPLWATYWFRVRATVPPSWQRQPVDLLWSTQAESTLWRAGLSLQGLHGTRPEQRPDARLIDAAEGGEKLELLIELACNGLFGELEDAPQVEGCELALVDRSAWHRYLDFELLRALEASETLEPSWGGKLRAELNRFCNERDPSILSDLYAHQNGSHAHQMAAIGHAHIDTAWLWPLAETQRKLVRTLSSQLRLADEYPEYRFAFSQAQHYAWLKEHNPDLWSRLKKKVADGQVVPVGGTWVEPDCNLPSGESLLRQFVHGQRFFEDEFGIRCREFWSPDAFGYCGQLPQLMRLAGISRFLTQKLSWNRFNHPEHHTFVWQGTDGSEVLAHFPPVDTYNSDASVNEVLHASRGFKDHETSATSLLVYGFGDGGGGPTRAMVENVRRMGDLQGLPRLRSATSDEFFSALEAEPVDRPTVVGELYLEYHRGVYTSQAWIKQANRHCEQLLHDAEFICAARGGPYPRAELDWLWKLLLLQQFHDILPGSSIGAVYDDARRDFEAVEAGARRLIGDGPDPVNTVGTSRREVLRQPDGDLCFVEADAYSRARSAGARDSVRADGLTLENRYLRVELAPDGSVRSLFAKEHEREVLAAAGNQLELYKDRPVKFDAWDIDPGHLETRSHCAPAECCRVASEGPLRAEVVFERSIGRSSRMRQTIRLDAESRRVEFETTVDWHEDHTLLKVAFPLAVRARLATYETPFGYAERPTDFSDSFAQSRYEVPGQRWADLSEPGFGVALLTDSKYGYSCQANTLRISLLRAPKSPDPQADMGLHQFTYALYPHRGTWREGGVVAEATSFNAPLRWTDVVDTSFASVDSPGLVLDGIKRGERSDALVLRLYEAFGAGGAARVRLATPIAEACYANALEEELGQVEVDSGALVVRYRPHEVVTILVAEGGR